MIKKGFTLIEVSAVILILGALAGFVFVKTQDKNQAVDEMKVTSDLEILKTALLAYSDENYDNFPVEECVFDEGDPDVCSFLLEIKPYMSGVPVPDSGVVYKYQNDGEDLCSLFSEGAEINSSYSCSGEFTEITGYPVAGVCGTYNGVEVNLDGIDDYAVGGLCSSGTAPVGVNDADAGWSWNCEGLNGGSTSSCLAYFPSNILVCSVSSDSCSVSVENSEDPKVNVVNLFNIYDVDGNHAEMPSESNYSNKVCCEGTNLTNEDTGTVVLRLSSLTNAHVEKGTESNYSNEVYLSSLGKNITCEYNLSCEEGYTCVASISDGDTNLHVGNCDAYDTKVCCQMINE